VNDTPDEYTDDDRFDKPGIRGQWVVIAESESKTMAEFAVNGLKSYDIPAVLDSGAGFLGTAGMQLRSLSDGKLATFKILTPVEYAEEAREVVKVFLGDGSSSDDDFDDEYTDGDSGDDEED